MKNLKQARRLMAVLTAGIVIVTASCSKENEKDNNKKLLILAALSIETRSHDALPLVPLVLASNGDAGSAQLSISQSAGNEVIPSGAAALGLRNIYAPVRMSVLVGKQMVKMGGQIITRVEQVLAQNQFKGVTSFTAQVNDNSDAAHPGRIVRVSPSTTYGTGGRKVEVWWTNTGADSLRDGKKTIELDYLLAAGDTSGAIDGAMFFRALPEHRATEFAFARLDFKKEITAAGVKRTAYVQVQNYLDLRNITGGSAAFFITENETGTVNVEGAYTVTGLLMPFLDQNAAPDWEITDQRVYLFNGVGSDTLSKAVVNVVLPLRSESVAVAAEINPYANAQSWSLGELFTDGLLYNLNAQSGSFGALGTMTYLQFLNQISGSTLATTSTQAELIAALNRINTASLDASGQQLVANLKIITGIQNPVYFLRDFFGIHLIGQKDTSGLETIVGNNGVADYQVLQATLPSTFAWFTMEQLFTMDLSSSTNAAWRVISTHPATTGYWTNINEAPPAPTM